MRHMLEDSTLHSPIHDILSALITEVAGSSETSVNKCQATGDTSQKTATSITQLSFRYFPTLYLNTPMPFFLWYRRSCQTVRWVPRGYIYRMCRHGNFALTVYARTNRSHKLSGNTALHVNKRAVISVYSVLTAHLPPANLAASTWTCHHYQHDIGRCLSSNENNTLQRCPFPTASPQNLLICSPTE